MNTPEPPDKMDAGFLWRYPLVFGVCFASFGAVACVAMLAAALAPLLRRDREARFWTLGMVLALLPISATFPANRLLFFVGLGAMALLARLLASARR